MSHVVEPERFRFTVQDFVRLVESGLLPEPRRVELIEGDVIEKPPPWPEHMSVSNRLTRLFVIRAADTAIVSVTNALTLPPWSMPQPDFVLLRPRADEYVHTRPLAEHALLVVEVAHSSLRFDRTVKSRVYAKAGLADYWIVEADARRLHVLRDPDRAAGVYRDVRLLVPPFEVAPLALPGLVVGDEAVWPAGVDGAVA